METKKVTKRGFTIVELLTVMAVIAVLIGLLIPALSLVKDNAKKIQQKAQFHSIDVGVELYKSEFGSYPQSYDNNDGIDPDNTDDTGEYCGANKLAEAMVGLDLLGFHPNADFRSDGLNSVVDNTGATLVDIDIYDTTGATATWQTAQENIDARKGPYVDLENANAFRMDEVYATLPAPFTANFSPTSGGGPYYPLVMCDVYAKKRAGTGGKKTGTPILYFRANSNFSVQEQDVDNNTSGSSIDDDIYRLDDNWQLIQLGLPDDGTQFSLEQAVATGDPYQEFDKMIVNDQVQSIRRPYRADTYILISAGKDGDFGTADDIFNFEKEIIE